MAKGTVLVVDDDTTIQEFVALALEEEGYRVFTALDGDALALARQQQPDMVLLDVNMPGMDGIEVSKRLRCDPTTAHIPIVAMTAVAPHAVRGSMRADAWLPKPFDIQDLYTVVDTWLPGSADGHVHPQALFPS